MLLVLPYLAIDPVAFSIGPLDIRWYALAYIAGIVLGWLYIGRLVRDDRLWGGAPRPNEKEIDDFVLWATLGIVLGGRIGYVLFYDPALYLADPVEVVKVWHGGMSFHGGLAGVAVAMLVFARRRPWPWTALTDSVAAAAPIGLFFGRLANFVNGELWGRPTDVAWAMVFPHAGPEPRHPSQLYEAALEGVVLFLVLRLVTHRLHGLERPGFVTGLFAFGYGTARIIAEFFRMPDAQLGFLFGGATMGMLLSVPLVVLGLWLMLRPVRAPLGGRE